jgi:hypothetical protein
LNLLRATEENDHAHSSHETVLCTLPDLVRLRPADLSDIGSSLAMELLRLEDKFALSEFRDKVVASLTALAVHDPANVGDTLIVQLFEDGSLYNRLCALSALSNAALELSGETQLEEIYRIKQIRW